MDKVISQFFSMRMMALGMLIFLLAIGTATFIESAYDVQTAKLFIYNATWFEILLVYLAINLISNIFKYNLFQKEKLASLTFHISFLIILIGAGITRYISYEGLMLIREGESANFIYSSDPYIWMKINDGKLQYVYKEKSYQSPQYFNRFDIPVEFPNHKNPVSISFVNFRKKMIDSLVVNDSISGMALEIVTGGMNSNYLEKGGFLMLGDIAMSFDKKDEMPGISITEENKKIYLTSGMDVMYLPMAQMREARAKGFEVSDSAFTVVPQNTKVLLQSATLYKVMGQQFVFKGILNHAKKMLMPSGSKNVGTDYLTVKVTDGNKTKIVDLPGGMGQIPSPEVFQFEGLTYELEYGSSKIELPFSIACRDFQLDRYPGSNAPSSFASEVTILDPANNVKRNKRIFMNNVIDYGGYRFFQSAYDPDEKGTRLSVNHDSLGTNITYLGYLIMALGMMLSLFVKHGRFAEIRENVKNIQKRKETLLLFVLLSFGSFAQEGAAHADTVPHDHSSEMVKDESIQEMNRTPVPAQFISKEHAELLATIAVQDFQGRIIPFHTMCDQLLRKIARANTYEGKNAVTTILSMHMYPEYWMTQPIVYVPSNLLEPLGIKDNYASYQDLSDGEGNFKLLDEYNKAFQKLESKRNEFEKKLIKTVEKFQIVNQIFMWAYMKIIPMKADPKQTWYVPLSKELSGNAEKLSYLSLQYFSAIDKGAKAGNFAEADKLLADFKVEQRKEGSKVIPSESHINTEVAYNKMSIFKNSMYLYLLFGFLMLTLFIVRIFKNPKGKIEKRFDIINKITRYFIAGTAVYHASGLGMRWYITGHAPWSNGYEAMVFIALVTVIAGFLFSRKLAVVLAVTGILAFLMIFVSEMNLMDPEISPLQPVLKSYWLMIHVAIITGSYGFLGLGAILSLLNLSLYLFRNKTNGTRITLNINELTYVAEMTITVGLFMLTIGTFLGGIWANESWGRYWGWDPKETWALVSVLVYAIILHFRFIPALSSKFTFNVVGLWGYSAILFTFFGVNFYLVGLHSYANGEGLGRIPLGLIVTVLLFLTFTIIAALRNKAYKQFNK
ncbi:MAG: cytochrome c biogenesis protein CcsA [Crocinitomicaceae bacterium]